MSQLPASPSKHPPLCRGWMKGWKAARDRKEPTKSSVLSTAKQLGWPLLLAGIYMYSYLETNQMSSSAELQPNLHTYTKKLVLSPSTSFTTAECKSLTASSRPGFIFSFSFHETNPFLTKSFLPPGSLSAMSIPFATHGLPMPVQGSNVSASHRVNSLPTSCLHDDRHAGTPSLATPWAIMSKSTTRAVSAD